MELPINVMVIVVIAIIVLLAVAMLFFNVWTPGKDTLALEAAKNSGCQKLVSIGCNNVNDLSTITVSGLETDGITNLQGVCDELGASDCYKMCGCEGGTGGSGSHATCTDVNNPVYCCKSNSGPCNSGNYAKCESGTCKCYASNTGLLMPYTICPSGP